MGEQADLEAAVDEFAAAMKKRLNTKRRKRWYGWDYPASVDASTRLIKNAAKGAITGDKKSLVDAANFAMMLWRA